MKKVWIEPGCTSCGSCEAVCSDVFEVVDVAHVRENAPLKINRSLIEEAAEMCPVSVIKFEKDIA